MSLTKGIGHHSNGKGEASQPKMGRGYKKREPLRGLPCEIREIRWDQERTLNE